MFVDQEPPTLSQKQSNIEFYTSRFIKKSVGFVL